MKQWVLASRPEGLARVEDFRLETAPLTEIKEGQMLVKTLYLGVAPVMLRYMTNETSFERPLEIGDVTPYADNGLDFAIFTQYCLIGPSKPAPSRSGHGPLLHIRSMRRVV